MATYIQVLTDQGRNMVADADAGMTLTFTRVELSSGTIDPALIPPMIALPPVSEMDATISGPPIRDQPFQVIIPATIVPANIPRGFFMNAIGVWGTINGVNPQLYSVGYPVEDDGVTVGIGDFVGMPSGGSVTEHYLRIATAVNRAIDVQCIFDPMAVEVFVANVDEDIGGVPIPPDELGAGVWSRRTGSGYLLKRLKMGTNIDIEEDADTITIGQRTLTSDLDLFVDPSYADVSPNFSSIQNAHDYLIQFYIPSDRRATINVLAGIHNYDYQVIFNHPQSRQIFISGVDPIISIISAVAPNGAGNGILTVDTTAGIVINSSCLIHQFDPDPPAISTLSNMIKGGHFVTGITPTTINIAFALMNGYTLPPTAIDAGATVRTYPSKVNFTNNTTTNTQGFIFQTGIGRVENLEIRGAGAGATNSGNGISVLGSGEGNLQNLIIRNFLAGVNVLGSVSAGIVASYSNLHGFIVSRGGALNAINHLFANGNGQADLTARLFNRGFWCLSGGSMSLGSFDIEIYAQGNGGEGYLSDGGFIGLQNCKAQGNQVGGSASFGGFLRFGSEIQRRCYFNANGVQPGAVIGDTDLWAGFYAGIIGQVNGGNAGTFTPANQGAGNLLGNFGSYMSVS